MKREYGADRCVSLAVRLTEQEKEAIKTAAERDGLSVSSLIRQAIETYLKGGNK